jgi:cytochrome c
MDSFELNKVLGAVLGTCLALLSLNIGANALFSPHMPEKPGYEIAVQEEHGGAKPGEQAPAEEPLPVRLASADVGRGEDSVKKCAACHTFGKGEPNRVGPNLWGIVGRPKASEAGFNYSAAMKGQKGNWTPEDLDAYLTNPRGMVPGTNMTFAGLPRGKERADVIAYLNSKADNPAPLPKAAAPAPAPAKEASTPPANSPAAAPATPAAPPAVANPPAAAAPPAPAAPPAAPQAAAPQPAAPPSAPPQPEAPPPAAAPPAATPPAATPPAAAPEAPKAQ